MLRLGLIALLTASLLCAQTTPSAIGGVVFDTSDAVLADVEIVLVHENTGASRKLRTNRSGRFLFTALSPGVYRILASHDGFKSLVVPDVQLQIDQTRELELEMDVGGNSETITVSASTNPLHTETASVGQVVEGRAVVDLPLSGRNYLQLAGISAGVVPATETTGDANRIGRPETVLHVAGSRASFTSYFIDGQESRGSRFGESTLLPSLDAIQEIQRNFYSAEYGNSPVIITVSTKAGTTQFHESLFEFFRNSALDANHYFDSRAKSPLRLNQFGGTLGGPLAARRTFFFVGYEGRRKRLAQRRFATVPDPRLFAGNFSDKPSNKC